MKSKLLLVVVLVCSQAHLSQAAETCFFWNKTTPDCIQVIEVPDDGGIEEAGQCSSSCITCKTGPVSYKTGCSDGSSFNW
jgi:hypothetical protein